MLLAMDIGNSTTVIGLFDGERLAHRWRVSTRSSRTVDEHAVVVTGLLDLAGRDLRRDVDGVVLCSVVPPVSRTVVDMYEQYAELGVLAVEPGVRTGLSLRHDHPQDLGADRIANAVAVQALYGGPAIVVDFGTAISFDVVDEGGAFVGGAIAPGVATAADALAERAARLPRVEHVAPPSPLARSTVGALRSGIVYGYAGLVDGLVSRISLELGPGVTTVATGGAAEAVLGHCGTIDHHDPWLTLKGLRLIHERNRR